MRSQLQRLPEPFLERLRRILPPSRWQAVLQTFGSPRQTTLRANTLKTTAQAIRQELTAQGFGVEFMPWYREACVLRRGTLRELQETALYREGAIYVQSLSSMLPPLALDPQPGESVLDLTAAPGSKTTQLACLMRNEGRLVANDNNRVRFFKLKANLEQQGVRNVELTLKPGELFGRTHREQFDRVLLDAPCSAEGRFCAQEPSSYRYWKPVKVREMARKQKRLMAAAIHALKPGGTLVYSTCTFAPEENEAVVAWAFKKFGEAIALDAIALQVPTRIPPLSSWEGAAFPPEIRRAVRILPGPLFEGFFLARFKKSVTAGV